MIDEYDTDDDIKQRINWSLSTCEENSYYEYALKQLTKALSEYGKVNIMYDEGVEINIDLDQVLEKSGLDEEDIDNYFDNCSDDPECVITEIIGDYYDKPTFRIDDRWSPDIDDDLLIRLFQPPYQVPAKPFLKKLNGEAFSNKYYILRNTNRSVLAHLDQNKEFIVKVDKTNVYGINPRNAEQTFAVDSLINPDIRLVSMTGKAGTGKTLLALASALHVKKNYRQIFIARPIVPLSNKDIGYLPGDVESKLAPYMQPLWDNLKVIQDQFPENDRQHQAIDQMIKDQKLVIEPLSYIRGRSLQRIFFIVDEAQNLTPHEIKTIITRAGEGAKVVFTGDIYQIDHPYLDGQSNGLSYLIDRFKGQKLYAHINLEKGERSELAELASNLL